MYITITLKHILRFSDTIETKFCPMNKGLPHFFQNTADCRPLQCPFGQTRRNNGTCYFVSETWFVKTISLCLSFELANVTYLDVYKMFSQFETLGRFPDFFPYPWNGTWEIYRFFYAFDDETIGQTLQEIVVDIQMDVGEMFSISQFHQAISEQFLKPFNLTIDQKLIQMKPKFKEYCFFELTLMTGSGSKKNAYKPIWQNNLPGQFENVTTKEYFSTVYYYNFIANEPSLRITKLYFCEQVEFYEEDIEYFIFQDLLWVKNRKLLYENEFKVIRFNNSSKYRVCAEDVEFVTVPGVTGLASNYAEAANTLVSILVILVITTC